MFQLYICQIGSYFDLQEPDRIFSNFLSHHCSQFQTPFAGSSLSSSHQCRANHCLTGRKIHGLPESSPSPLLVATILVLLSDMWGVGDVVSVSTDASFDIDWTLNYTRKNLLVSISTAGKTTFTSMYKQDRLALHSMTFATLRAGHSLSKFLSGSSPTEAPCWLAKSYAINFPCLSELGR